MLRGRHIVSVRAFWKAFLRTRMPLWCTANKVFKGPRFVAKMFWGFPNFQGSLLNLRWGTCGGDGVCTAHTPSRRLITPAWRASRGDRRAAQDRRKDAASDVVERVRQPDVVVQLDVHQIAELRKVDVATSIFICPSEQVVDAVVVQGQRVLQLDEQLLQFIPINLPGPVFIHSSKNAFQVIYFIR